MILQVIAFCHLWFEPKFPEYRKICIKKMVKCGNTNKLEQCKEKYSLGGL